MLGVALSDLTGQIKKPRWAAGQTQGSIFTKVYHKAEVQSMNELDDLTLIMQGKAGDTDATNALWERHQNFIRQQMAKIYAKNKGLADRVGIDRDDLIVEGWFSVRDAVRRYDPGKRMAFLTVLGWSIRATATKVLTTSRGKLLRDENGTQTRVPADPLNYALSSDLPLEDDTDNTIADVYADPTVNLEQDFENEQNRRAVMAALYSLKPNHRSILEQRYRYNRTLQEIADDRGVSRQSVNVQEKAALKNFKKALNIETLNRLE